MINVVAYARFSSDNQRTESIDAQVRAIKEYCLKNNFNLLRIYKDEGISGTSIKDRIEFIKMIVDSKKKDFKYVIVHKFDRFARNRYDHAIFEKKLEDNGVKLLSVLENLTDSPESVILKAMLTGMNEYYSLNLAREVRKGQKENALKCVSNGGITPLGYDLDENKKYIINEKESKIVKEIYKLYLNGVGYTSIASILNKKGYLNKLGKPFRKTSIREFLLNEKYTGTFIFGKKDKHGKLTGTEIRIENGIPAIISKEDFEKVQEKLKEKTRGARITAKTPYFLSGYCICGECGGNYSGGYRNRNRNGTINYGYLCINRKTKINNCKNKPIIKEKLEEMVFGALRNEIFDKRIDTVANSIFNKINEKQKEERKGLKKIDKELEVLTNKSLNLLEKNLNGKIANEVFERMNDKINEEIAFYKSKKEKLDIKKEVSKKEILEYLRNLKKNMEKEEIKKAIVMAFIDSVIIYPSSVEIRIKEIPTYMDKVGGDDGN